MWQILFLVNPVTVTLALAFFLATAGIASKLYFSDTFRRSHARATLAVLTVIYFSVLLIGFDPLSEDDDVDNPEIHWNPLHFLDGLGEQNDTEESFAQTLPNGDIAFYSPERVSTDEPPTGTQNVDFFVHGSPERLSVLDDEGQEVEENEARSVERHMSEAIALNEGTEEHAALIYEEKVMNVLLFVPIGIVSAYCFSRVSFRVLYGPLMSIAIEGSQWIASGGNVVDSADVAANSLGSLIGTSFAAAFILLFAFRQSHKNSKEADALQP